MGKAVFNEQRKLNLDVSDGFASYWDDIRKEDEIFLATTDRRWLAESMRLDFVLHNFLFIHDQWKIELRDVLRSIRKTAKII